MGYYNTGKKSYKTTVVILGLKFMIMTRNTTAIKVKPLSP